MNVPTPQTIVLEDERIVTVFTENGRVFGDLTYLYNSYAAVVEENMNRPDLNDHERAYLLGQIDMLDAIRASIEALYFEHKMYQPSAIINE